MGSASLRLAKWYTVFALERLYRKPGMHMLCVAVAGGAGRRERSDTQLFAQNPRRPPHHGEMDSSAFNVGSLPSYAGTWCLCVKYCGRDTRTYPLDRRRPGVYLHFNAKQMNKEWKVL